MLEEVFRSDKQTVHRSPERVSKLIFANRIKLNFEYSMKGLYGISTMVFIVGIVTYSLSKKEVNQNEIFGWFTLLQCLTITSLFAIVKLKKEFKLLLPAVLLYFSIWIVELVFCGMPNDLLEAYNHHKANVPPSFTIQLNVGGARILGLIFPLLYLGLKLFAGWMLFRSYRNYIKYETLAKDIKDDLNDF